MHAVLEPALASVIHGGSQGRFVCHNVGARSASGIYSGPPATEQGGRSARCAGAVSSASPAVGQGAMG